MKLINLFRLFATMLVTVAFVHLGLTGCTTESESYFMGAMGLNEGRIFVANSVAAPVSYSVAMYSLTGEFIKIIADTSSTASIPRGLAILDPFHIILSSDTPDELKSINILDNSITSYANNALLTGNIYDVVSPSAGTFLIAESSTIEMFVDQARYPAAGNAYIIATVGACTINTARGMAINNAGELIVASFTNNSILRYDISTTTASCLTADASFGANQPIPVVSHPNGKIYFGTQVNDAIYEAPEDLSAGPTILVSANASISNPLAMAVLPNGNLLVASDGIDSIVEVATDGTIVNGSFIKNALTGTISSILVVPAQ